MQIFDTWLHYHFPRKVYPTNIDFALHTRKGNAVLFLEFKRGPAPDAQVELLQALKDGAKVDYVIIDENEPGIHEKTEQIIQEWWEKHDR